LARQQHGEVKMAKSFKTTRGVVRSKRLATRVESFSMPAFHGIPPVHLCGVTVVTAGDGELYRVDADKGTIRKLVWEK
jgi:hypothetical protein